MIKRIMKILLCLIFFISTISLVACAVNFHTDEEDFVYNYNEALSIDADANFAIDGVLKESEWNGKKYYDLRGEDYSFKVTTHFSDTGLYAAVVIEDVIYYRQFSNFATNTNLVLKVKASPNGSIYTFSADLVSARRSTNSAMKSKLEGNKNQGKSTFTFEMYTTWENLGVSQKPTEILVLPTYHRIQNEFDSKGTDLSPAFSQNMKTSLYLDFNENGYAQADRENAILGDSGYGVTKSSGWDVSKEDQGIVRSYKQDYQAIFFKNAFYDSYIIEAKITPIGGINDSDPRLGVMSYVDLNTWKATMLYGKNSNLETNSNGIKYFKSNSLSQLTFYPDGDWHWNDAATNTATNNEYENGLTFRMVKVKNLFLYIINGELKYVEQVSYLGGKTLAGFYSLGMEAEFSDYKIENLEGNDNAAEQELSKYGYTLNLERTPGGTVSSDKVFIAADDTSVTIRATASNGYVFTGLTQNNVDIFDSAVSNINADGSFTINRISENTTFKFTFSRIEKENQCVVSGIVTDSGGKIMNGVELDIYDKVDKYNSYRVTTDISGKYSVTVTKNKEYEASINAGVNYHLFSQNFNVGSGDAASQSFVITKKVVGGFSNGLLGSPSSWDLSNEQNGVVKALNVSNGKPIFFTDFIADNALVKATIKYTPVANGETSPAAGFAIGDSGAISRIMLFGSGIRILRYGHWGSGDLTDLWGVTDLYNFGGENESEVTLVMLRRGTSYYLFIENNDILTYFYTAALDTVKGPASFGFVTTSSETKPLDIEYSNYSISSLTDEQALDMIEKKTMFTVTSTIGDGGSCSITGMENDKINGGLQTITITPQDKVVTKFTINGVDVALGSIENGSYKIKHIFTENTQIVVEFMPSIELSSSVAFSPTNYSTHWDLSKTKITFSLSGIPDIIVYPNALGEFTANLVNYGTEYTVVFNHPNAMQVERNFTLTDDLSQTISETVLGGGVVNGVGQKDDGANISLDTDWTVDANGNFSPAYSDGRFSMISGGYGEKFIVEATFKNSGSTDDWAMAGFRFLDGNNSFVIKIAQKSLAIGGNPWIEWGASNETIHYDVFNKSFKNNTITLRIIKDGDVYYVVDKTDGGYRILGKIDSTKTQLNQYSNFNMPKTNTFVGIMLNSGGAGNLGKVSASNIVFIGDSDSVNEAVNGIVQVSGKVSFNDENKSPNWKIESVKMQVSDGSSVKNINISSDGTYKTMLLKSGNYIITCSQSRIQTTTHNLIPNGENAQTFDITLGLGKVNGAYEISSDSWYNWDLNWENSADGIITPSGAGAMSSLIGGALGEKYIVDATFKNLGSSDEWAGAGFRFGNNSTSFNIFFTKDAMMLSNNPWITWASANETIHWGATSNITQGKVSIRVIKDGATYYVIDVTNGKNKLLGKVDDTKTQLNKYTNFVMPPADCYGGIIMNSGGGSNKGKITAENIKLICDESVIDAEIAKVTA